MVLIRAATAAGAAADRPSVEHAAILYGVVGKLLC